MNMREILQVSGEFSKKIFFFCPYLVFAFNLGLFPDSSDRAEQPAVAGHPGPGTAARPGAGAPGLPGGGDGGRCPGAGQLV